MRKIMLLTAMMSSLLLTGSHLTTLCKIAYADDKPQQQKTELSDADRDFLKQCQVQQVDIDIIPQLSQKTQARISGWIAAKDCQSLEPFKITRNYYRQLKPDTPLHNIPKGFSMNYLTPDEAKNFQHLLNLPPLE